MLFQTAVCSKRKVKFAPAQVFQQAVVWNTEIDSARNEDELKSSNSVPGRMIPDFEVFESKIASTLKNFADR